MRRAALALGAHASLGAALRSLFGDLAQTSPAPTVELDARTCAELSDIAVGRLGRLHGARKGGE